jgi:hypothetical protein
MSDETQDDSRPQLRVVRGEPTPEELAVLTAVVTAAASGSDDEAPEPARGRWSDPAWQHRRPLLHGPGGWRAAVR